MSALLLAGLAAESSARLRGGSATPGQDLIQETADRVIPVSIGDWIGRPITPSAATVALLRPQVLQSLKYENVKTGESATLIFVYCSDPRDLQGHYPPSCYPGQGYVQQSVVARTWSLGDLGAVDGMRYRFTGHGAESTEIVVDNFMVVPTVGFERDMEAVNRAAGDNRLRRFGAAEVQIITDASLSDARRDEVFRMLLLPAVPLLRCVLERADSEIQK